MKKAGVLFVTLVFVGNVFGQEIHKSDKMWSKRVVRAIDLRETQNEPMYARGNELPKLLIEALKEGKLTPYLSDSLNKESIISEEEYKAVMSIPSDFVEEDTDFMDSLDKIDYEIRKLEAQSNFYFPRDLYQLELTEEIIFDKNHSVLERKIIAITVFVPADHYENIKGIQLPVATFDYQECEKLFKNELAASIWFNQNNDSAHMNLADAFELRLFSSYLIKVSNPAGEYIVDKYGGDALMGIIGSENEEMKLMNYEHDLWEN